MNIKTMMDNYYSLSTIIRDNSLPDFGIKQVI